MKLPELAVRNHQLTLVLFSLLLMLGIVSFFTMPRSEDPQRSEEHTSELQSRPHLVCRLLLEKKKHHDAHPGPHTRRLAHPELLLAVGLLHHRPCRRGGLPDGLDRARAGRRHASAADRSPWPC